MFEGFKKEMIDTGEASIRVRYGGGGLPVLLGVAVAEETTASVRVQPARYLLSQ